MSEHGTGSDHGTTCSCKVGRSTRKYGCPEVSAAVRRRHESGASLRELEAFVNRELLRGALRAGDVDVLGGVDAVYRSLTDDDASAGTRTETHTRLARAGVDVDALEADFVSYGTVRTHLRECLEVDTGRTGETTVEGARGTIEWARSRSEGITARTLKRLRDEGHLDTGDLDPTHVVRVTCVDCDTSYPVNELLDRGACRCEGA